MTFRSRLALTASAAAVLASTALLAPGASAHPGHPGTASDAPVVLFNEDFEDGLDDGEVTTLDAYGDYTADSAWLDQANGNGLVSDGNTTDAAFTSAGFTQGQASRFGDLRAVATAIGALNGTSPSANNHAVTAYTSTANPGADKVEFATEDPITLEADGRFLTISATIGAVNCHAAHPRINFFLTDDGGAETAVNTSALDGCGSSTSATPAVATTLTGGRAVLFQSDKVGVVMRNAEGSGGGNDHAFDDIRVLDATPQLDKVFEDRGPFKPGETTNLILTVTNTSELAAKPGWSFTDHLPSGLTVAGAATSTCDADVTASTGAKEVEVADGTLTQGQTSCSVTVPVTSKTRSGTFRNSASNIESVGLNDPGATFVKFVAPAEPKDDDKKKDKDDNDDSDDDDGDDDKELPSTGAPWYVNPWTGVAGVLMAVGGTVGFARLRRHLATEDEL